MYTPNRVISALQLRAGILVKVQREQRWPVIPFATDGNSYSGGSGGDFRRAERGEDSAGTAGQAATESADSGSAGEERGIRHCRIGGNWL
jgi:hypothetical protein